MSLCLLAKYDSLTLAHKVNPMALDITIRVPDSDRIGFIQKLLRLFPSVRVVSEKPTESENSTVAEQIDTIDPNMLFAKWTDLDTDGQTLRRQSWRREEY